MNMANLKSNTKLIASIILLYLRRILFCERPCVRRKMTSLLSQPFRSSESVHYLLAWTESIDLYLYSLKNPPFQWMGKTQSHTNRSTIGSIILENTQRSGTKLVSGWDRLILGGAANTYNQRVVWAMVNERNLSIKVLESEWDKCCELPMQDQMLFLQRFLTII